MIIRTVHHERYTVLANATIRDPNLSLRATGLLIRMLSQPDNSRLTVEAISRWCSEGRDVVASALREIETAGYLKRVRRRDQRGQWVWDAYLLDRPEAPDDGEPPPPPYPIMDGPDDSDNLGHHQTTAPQGTETQGIKEEVPKDQVPTTTTLRPAPRSAERASANRKRDLLWEAVLTACGIDPLGAMTRSARGAYNRAVGELRALGVSPQQATERAKAHRQRWPKVSLTPSSLARHWSELQPQHALAGSAPAVGTPSCPCGLPTCPGPSEGFAAIPGAHVPVTQKVPVVHQSPLIGLDHFAIGALPT